MVFPFYHRVGTEETYDNWFDEVMVWKGGERDTCIYACINEVIYIIHIFIANAGNSQAVNPKPISRDVLITEAINPNYEYQLVIIILIN